MYFSLKFYRASDITLIFLLFMEFLCFPFRSEVNSSSKMSFQGTRIEEVVGKSLIVTMEQQASRVELMCGDDIYIARAGSLYSIPLIGPVSENAIAKHDA